MEVGVGGYATVAARSVWAAVATAPLTVPFLRAVGGWGGVGCRWPGDSWQQSLARMCRRKNSSGCKKPGNNLSGEYIARSPTQRSEPSRPLTFQLLSHSRKQSRCFALPFPRTGRVSDCFAFCGQLQDKRKDDVTRMCFDSFWWLCRIYHFLAAKNALYKFFFMWRFIV